MKTKSLVPIFALLLAVVPTTAATKPNVLFIAVDDLNDWIGCLGGHPQSVTPNFDRLAANGMLFTNAHCTAPSCNPSRTAIMSGRSPDRTGMYNNAQKMRDVMPDEVLLPKYFSNHGYWSAGSGKLLHYVIDPQSWDEYFPEKSKDDPFPRTFLPEKRPLSLPRGGPWQYNETDWGPLNVSDEEAGGDWLVSDWIGQQLRKKHDKPFFLACGIYHPHEPWFVPAKYFEKFPLESIQLPPGYLEGDLDDVPEAGRKLARNRYFPHIQAHGQWKQAIQSYLASINYADAMLGRVLNALEQGPNNDSTVVVLWSDHGWHLGEKEHWQKYTGWRVCTRVPLMVNLPPGASEALPEGVKPGGRCDQAVGLIDLFPTLTDLCGLPKKASNDGRSLVPLLRGDAPDPEAVAITYLSDGKSLAISGKDWRYIRYADQSEELYHIATDRFEHDNLAGIPAHAAKLAEFRKRVPKNMVPMPGIKVADLIALDWHPHREGEEIPVSKPDGSPMRLAFVNERAEVLKFFRVEPGGAHTEAGRVAPGATVETQGSPGSVWEVTDDKGRPLGYFIVDDRAARAVIR